MREERGSRPSRRLGGGLRRKDMYRTGPKSTGTVPTLPCSLVGQIRKPWPMPEACNYRVRASAAFSGDVGRSVFDTNRDFVKSVRIPFSCLGFSSFARHVRQTPHRSRRTFNITRAHDFPFAPSMRALFCHTRPHRPREATTARTDAAAGIARIPLPVAAH